MQFIINFMCICYSYSYITDKKLANLYVPSNNKRFVRSSDENYQNVGQEYPILIDFITPIKRKNHDPGIPLLHSNQVLTRRKDKSFSSSTSFETEEFKNNFMSKDWLKVQVDALDANITKGDTVNILAARPLGFTCRDPYQIGTEGICVSTLECAPEMRIYRGDVFCGRTEFGCCSIMEAAFAINKPIDLSFESLSNEPPEYTKHKKNAEDRDKAFRKRHKKERKRLRIKRKKYMKKYIRRIVKELEKALKRTYLNATKKKVKKTKQMKLYLSELKKQLLKDRLAILDEHTIDIIKIDKAFQDKIKTISYLDEAVLKNETLKDVIKGRSDYLTKRSAKMLIEAYPALEEYVKIAPRIKKTVNDRSKSWSLESKDLVN